MVSICCITYNQAAYIRDALEGFVNQETDFPYEVLIHDDASTDGTAQIIQEYADRYPERIFPILQTENQYSKGLTNVSGTFNFPRARGRYIAMCEGDDYWTDTKKLQKQVDYLEANPGCSLCFHSAKVEVQGKALTEHDMRPYKGSRMISPEEIIDKSSGYAMSSMAFPARLVKELPDYYVDCPVGDTPLQLLAAANGYGYYMDEPMSAYRVGVAGSWTVEGKSGDYEGKQSAYYWRMKRTYEQFDRATGGRFHQASESATLRTYYHTMVNTKKFDEIYNPAYRRYYRELTPRTRFFLRFERSMPGAYKMARKAFTGR